MPKIDIGFAHDWDWNTSKDGAIKEAAKPFRMNAYCSLNIMVAWRYGKWSIEPEVSLPKMFYKNNVEVLALSDVEAVLNGVMDQVRTITGVKFDPFEAGLSKLAIGYNWQVDTQEEVYARISAARCSDYARRMRGEIWEDGIDSVYVRNKGLRITDEEKLYSKFDETEKRKMEGTASAEHVEMAERMLRLERTLTSRALKHRGIRTEHMLAPYMAEQIVAESMKNFGLDQMQFGRDERIVRLREHCITANGKFQAVLYRNLRSTLASVDDIGSGSKKELIMETGMSEPTYYSHKNHLKRAGVWLSRANRESLKPLPTATFPEDRVTGNT